VVETELDDERLLGVSGGSGTSGSLGEQTLLLGRLGLGGVLAEKGEEGLGYTDDPPSAKIKRTSRATSRHDTDSNNSTGLVRQLKPERQLRANP